MIETDKIIDECIECGICVEECAFLKKVCESPKELALKMKSGYYRDKPMIPYSCNLCDLCETLCENELNIGRMCLEIRQRMVKEGLGPLRAHNLLIKEQDWVLSDSFTLAVPDPQVKECQRVFFPGCNLSGYSPSLVLQTYDYLRKNLPGTGIFLGCCGSPNKEVGQQDKYHEIIARLEDEMGKLGGSEMIVACPYCYYSLKEYGPSFELKSLFNIMLEIGLPDNATTGDCKLTIHDSCRSRYETEMQDSVRALLSNMGYQIEEMQNSRDQARCCGMGGMAAYVDFVVADEAAKKRIGEASHDIVTSCASCRETFARHSSSLHILDLVFNPEWQIDKNKPTNKLSIKRENQSDLKYQIEKRFK